MSRVMEQVGLPAGQYDATLLAADLRERNSRKRPWLLELTAKIDRNGTEVLATKPLGEGRDPYELTSAQRRGLRDFAARLGVQSTGPAEEIVAAVRGLAGQTVTARLRPGPMGLIVTLSRGEQPETVTGEIVEAADVMPPVDAEYRDITLDAQGAHEQLLTGLRHANRGFALAAQACFALRRDEGWVALGYDTLGGYLADPDVSIGRAMFYALADIHEHYVLRGGLEQQQLTAGWSKLEVPLPAIKAGTVTAEEALADAEALGLRDLREQYRNGDGANGAKALSVKLPFACTACGSVIESTEQTRAPAGIEYRGHRWPDGWAHEQVIAAVEAAEALTFHETESL